MNETQKKIYNIFISVKEICETHDLRYWAIGGTCLGAVRHRGFIPWDIDMDIAMPNDDYERFMGIAESELRKRSLDICKRSPGHSVARAFDPKTTFISPDSLDFPERYLGVHLDIMPFYGMPAEARKRISFARKMGLLHTLDSIYTKKLKNFNKWKSMLVWFAISPLRLTGDQDFFYKKWVKNASKHRYDDSAYTGFLWAGYKSAPNLILKTEWFNEWIELPFENTTIRCPKDYDSYLKTQYGDYMTPPPVEEQEALDAGWFIDMDRPYHYYQEHGLPDEWNQRRGHR